MFKALFFFFCSILKDVARGESIENGGIYIYQLSRFGGRCGSEFKESDCNSEETVPMGEKTL